MKFKIQKIKNNTNNKESVDGKNVFDRYFGTEEEFKQGLNTVGDCRLIAALDGIYNLSSFKKLINSHIMVAGTEKNISFAIKLPLGSPNPKTYRVNSYDLRQQSSISGGNINIAETEKLGILALIHAFGQSYTGKKNFDYNRLTSGMSALAINHLIYGMKTLSHTSTVNREKCKKGLKERLDNLNPRQDVLIVSVIPNSEILHDFESFKKDKKGGTHAITVEGIKEFNDKKFVEISNPRDASVEIIINYDDFFDYVYSYEFSSKNIESIDGEYEILDIIDNQHGNQVDGGGYFTTLNEVIQLTDEINNDERNSRGDVIVTKEESGKLRIVSRGKEDVFIEKKPFSLNTTIQIGNEKLILPNNLSATYKNKENGNYQLYLYFARIAVFINKLRHDYIDPQKGDSKNKTPFSIGNSGELLFDDNPDKFSGINYIKRAGSEFFGDDNITILENWDLLGIKSKENKVTIKDFLNKIYNQG